MKKIILFILVTMLAVGSAEAQSKRRVTPVEQSTNITLPSSAKVAKKEPKAKLPTTKYDKDTLINDTLYIAPDTLNFKHMKYPLLSNVVIGANIWDPLMRLFGQTYGGMDFSAELSLWNRIFPAIELGVGAANATPEDMNYTYKGKLAPYGKLGFNYNFLYNKTPDYQALLGFRVGYTSFKYDITDINLNAGYWGETVNTEILNQKSHAAWGELLFGIRVKLLGNVSMGWAFKYHFLFSYKKNQNSIPWYIPGYGSRNGSVTGGMSVYYTLPIKKKDRVTKDAYTGDPFPEQGKPGEQTVGNGQVLPPPSK